MAMFAAMSASAEPNTRLALVGGMLLDGYGGVPIHHAAILLENNRIVAAGPASEILIPAGTPVIDTRGETMMPSPGTIGPPSSVSLGVALNAFPSPSTTQT